MAVRYVTVEEVKNRLGLTSDTVDADVARAIEAAADWVDKYLGVAAPFPDPVPAGVQQATLNLAIRWYKSPDAPYGVAGAEPFETGGDDRPAGPEGDPDITGPLLGLRQQWGIA